MPTNLPSSFASAAAGQNASRDSRAGNRDSRGQGGEWTRREGKPSNGTLTFRRSSSAQANTPAGASESNMAPPSDSTNTPQPMLGAEGARYSREDVLGLFESSGDGNRQPGVAELFMAGWNPGSGQGQINGHSSHSWGKPSDAQAPKDLDSCWNPSGDTRPMAMVDMTAEEREMFQTDVNSPLKQHAQNKDGGQGTGPNGRKASMSHGTPTQYGLSSPTSARPGTRRRESIDPSPFSAGLTSPTAARYGRDDPSYWFGRKGGDKENDAGDEDPSAPGQNRDSQPRTPFGLPRTNTGGSASAGGIGSLWSNPAPTPGSGAPGLGTFGNFALPTSSGGTKQFGGGKGESRLARLIPQESNENMAAKAAAESGNADLNRSWRSRPRTDTDPFGEDNVGGSALLGGIRDTSPPPLPKQPGQGAYDTPMKGGPADLGMSGLHLNEQDNGPLSPSGTNPYGSPAERVDNDNNHEGEDFEKMRAAADPSHAFNATSRAYGGNAFDGSDRSQTSSAGPRAYPSLNTYGGWPSGGVGVGSVGTPDRERAGFAGAFGNTIFSPMADPQSAGLGFGAGVFGGQGPVGSTPSIGRGSKLGSLFPAQMQAQMQSQDHDALGDSVPDLQQSNPLGAIGRGSIGHRRDPGAPLRTGQGVLEEVFGSAEAEAARSRNMGFSTPDSQPAISSTAQGQAFTTTAPGVPFTGSTQAQTDPPTAQHRTMVMPDRMRWVYLDPQGQTQGPFTGLEMNDWYKANFFTPDLRVKKVEDKEFEPLGQLIRRIGNSREPFLVPQIGIPHGPPTQSGPFSPAGGNAGVLPPLSGVFPSFGRTLTAEEQNNLERRKQEEQLIMAQQREAYMRLQQQGSFRLPGAVGGALHHHSSAHSLQSQPSFGSISSPIGLPPQTAPIGTAPTVPPAAAAGGYFDTPSMAQTQTQARPPGTIGSGSVSGADLFREDDLANLSTTERQVLASIHASGAMSGPDEGEGAHPDVTPHGVRTQLPTTEQLAEDPQGFRERLMQFEELRAQRDAEDAAAASVTSGGQTEEHEGAPISMASLRSRQMSKDSSRVDMHGRESRPDSSGGPGQKMPATTAATSSGLPMPFPPPERYEDDISEEERSASPVQPPPMAPWAKETESHRKGPSLKEIQEAEARKAAKAELAAQAARRAALEQEAAELREKEKSSVVAAPGLPTSSTWGQHSPVNAASPWAKPTASKSASAAAAAQAQAEKRRKTLAEIQREEEARKQKAKDSVMASVGTTAASSAGKRYADLASKPNPPPLSHSNTSVAAGGGWATVGAGGKVKVPTGPAAQARSVSTGNVKLAITKPATPRPAAAPATSASATKSDSGNAAVEEFKKWLHRELARGITVNNIDDFASTLMLLPLEVDTISDAVYANSTTMNGKHFAEEFIRRKRLADKGVIEKQPSSAANDTKTGNSSGGWNEVAKKGGHATKDQASGDAMAGAGFKVVPGRKKGKK